MDKWWSLGLLIFTALISFACGRLEIVDLKVPSTIENGSTDDVILDCDYEVEGKEDEIIVKWYFGSENNMIYQWIPNRHSPQALGLFKDRVNLDYKASNDSLTMYRALKISDVTPELSGLYICRVTSLQSEDVEMKKMTIYEPEKYFEIFHDEDTDTVNCTATGISPRPRMNVFISTINGTVVREDDDDDDDDNERAEHRSEDNNVDLDLDDDGIVDAEEAESNEEDVDFVEENDDGTFNITATYVYDERVLSGETVFVCKLWIEGTTYKNRITETYYVGGIPTTVETQIESDFYGQNTTDEGVDSASNLMISNFLMFAMVAVLVPRI